MHRKLKRRNYCEPLVRRYYYIYGRRRGLSSMVSGLLFPYKIIVTSTTVYKVECIRLYQTTDSKTPKIKRSPLGAYNRFIFTFVLIISPFTVAISAKLSPIVLTGGRAKIILRKICNCGV